MHIGLEPELFFSFVLITEKYSYSGCKIHIFRLYTLFSFSHFAITLIYTTFLKGSAVFLHIRSHSRFTCTNKAKVFYLPYWLLFRDVDLCALLTRMVHKTKCLRKHIRNLKRGSRCWIQPWENNARRSLLNNDNTVMKPFLVAIMRQKCFFITEQEGKNKRHQTLCADIYH